MGIGNDIRPKKVYQFNHKRSTPIYKPHFEVEKKQSLDNASQENTDTHKDLSRPEGNPSTELAKHSHEELQKLENEFFEKEKSQNTEKNDKNQDIKVALIPSSPRFSIGKIFTIIAAALLIFIVIYQNYDLVKDKFKSDKNKPAPTSSNEDTYQGTVNQETSTQQEPQQEEVVPTQSQETATTPTVQETTTPETSQTAATQTEPVIDKSTISLEVLNGNGITGSADIVKNTLVAAGFTVSKVANARSFSYTKTYIYYKTSKEAEARLVSDALASKQPTLEASDTVASSYDVVVVVGKN